MSGHKATERCSLKWIDLKTRDVAVDASNSSHTVGEMVKITLGESEITQHTMTIAQKAYPLCVGAISEAARFAAVGTV